jgi:uncharacterized protein (TIGR03083 family)
LNKRELVRGVVAERRRTIAFLSELPPETFDTPTALPRWRIREVVAHLITTDRAALTGSIMLPVLRSFDSIEAWNDRQVVKWADRPVRDLLLGLDRWGRRFVVLARMVPGPLLRMRLPSMFGKGRAELLLWARVFDEWVHRQDMRRALGLPDEEVDVELPAEFLLTAAVSSTLPNVEGDGTVALALEGVALSEWTYDLFTGMAVPRRRAVPGARIHMPAAPFVMATAGRDRFADLEERGVLTIEGDADLAHRFLSKLRIV